MEPQFQTSFIPKKPILSGTRDSLSSDHSTNLFSVFSTIVFIIALILCGALFAYKQLLTQQIQQSNASVLSAKDAFQPDTIRELTDVSSRISATQKLLNSHIAVYQVFDILQLFTLKKVRFSNFDFQNKQGVLAISMNVESQSYNALATQLDTFSKTESVKTPTFTDFDISDNGNVITRFQATINPVALSYRNAVGALNSNP